MKKLILMAIVAAVFFVINFDFAVADAKLDQIGAKTEKRWENIKTKLNFQPIPKGSSKPVPSLCNWVKPREAASVAYLGISKNGKPRFQISHPHWMSATRYWIEKVNISLEEGEILQLGCGYELVLSSFDKKDAVFETRRW